MLFCLKAHFYCLFLFLSRKTARHFLHLCPSPPGKRWRDAHGFMPAGRFTAPQQFTSYEMQAACDGRFASLSTCVIISSDSSTCTRRWTSNAVTCRSGLPILRLTFHKFVRMVRYCLTPFLSHYAREYMCLFPFPLSSWRMRPYRMHYLCGTGG